MALCSTKELCDWLGYKRPSDAEKWLQEHGVPYQMGRNGPVTTEDAVNSALFSTHQKARRETVEFR